MGCKEGAPWPFACAVVRYEAFFWAIVDSCMRASDSDGPWRGAGSLHIELMLSGWDVSDADASVDGLSGWGACGNIADGLLSSGDVCGKGSSGHRELHSIGMVRAPIAFHRLAWWTKVKIALNSN